MGCPQFKDCHDSVVIWSLIKPQDIDLHTRVPLAIVLKIPLQAANRIRQIIVTHVQLEITEDHRIDTESVWPSNRM